MNAFDGGGSQGTAGQNLTKPFKSNDPCSGPQSGPHSHNTGSTQSMGTSSLKRTPRRMVAHPEAPHPPGCQPGCWCPEKQMEGFTGSGKGKQAHDSAKAACIGQAPFQGVGGQRNTDPQKR